MEPMAGQKWITKIITEDIVMSQLSQRIITADSVESNPGLFTSHPSQGGVKSGEAVFLREKPSNLSQVTFTYFREVIATTTPLLIGDIFFLTAGLLFVNLFIDRFGVAIGFFSPTATDILPVLSVNLFIVFLWFGLFPAVMIKPIVEFKKLIGAISLAFASYFAIVASLDWSNVYQWLIILPTYLLSLVLIPLGRSIIRKIFAHFTWWGHRALVVGEGPAAEEVFSLLKSGTKFGLRPVALISAKDRTNANRNLSKEYRVNWIVLCEDRRYCMESLTRNHIRATARNILVVVPAMVDACRGDSMPPFERVDFPEYQIEDRLHTLSHRIGKRIFDVVVSLMALAVLSPLLLLIMLLIKIQSPGPVFYKHERIGRYGTHFYVYKLRTMEVDADKKLNEYLDANPQLREEWEETQKLQDDPRISKIGKLLRKTSIDELPQLWNVLIGDMSIVGPRPIVQDEVKYYGDSFELYKTVSPGITGLWQISGRNHTTYSRRVQLDCLYVRNWSFCLDLYTITKTIITVILRRGAF